MAPVREWVKRLALLVAVLAVPLAAASFARAQTTKRLALVVGVGDYNLDNNGLQKLLAPPNDAEQIAAVLKRKGFDFSVTLLKDQDVKDKTAFQNRFKSFLSTVEPGSEVVFYFSGHGGNIPGKGNFYLLPDAKGEAAYLKTVAGPSGETADKAKSRYQDWLSQVAISEDSIRDSIQKQSPRVTVIIADACRSYVTDPKATSPIAPGVIKPKQIPPGVLMLYSAREGQVSLDARGTGQEATPETKDKDRDKDKKETKREAARKVNSLFTSVLLRHIEKPLFEINQLATQVKLEVRNQARELNVAQVPDFNDSPDAADFYFYLGDSKVDIQARCRTAAAELQELRYGVSHGFISGAVVEQKKVDLAPCGLADEIDRLASIQRQGGGELSTRVAAATKAIATTTDPTQLCDLLASTPLDANRTQGTGTIDIQSVAVSGGAAGGNREKSLAEVNRAIDACSKAVAERSRVARLKFNLGRSYYAKAAVAPGDERKAALALAAKHFQDAVDLGYAAAYNSVAQLYQDNQYFDLIDGKPKLRPNDRDRTRDLLERGAGLGDVMAQYNLGLAYKNGDLGLDVGKRLNEIQADAFQWMSKAAESGLVPAMIDTAVALYYGQGILEDRKRAVDLLELAASRGSWEAMYNLGQAYNNRDDRSEAIIWYARAAEGGDSRSQAKLARLLTDGDGLPAPQREAAARYWRLAANGGLLDAQVQLANLLRDGTVPFRPNPKSTSKPDGGAQEIFELYSTAFARGFPGAGLELARLFRKGFPAGGSDAVPKSPEYAINLLWKTMDRVRQADPNKEDANPEFGFQAAFELIKMYDAGEAKRPDGSSLLLDDQIEQLRADYGDPSKLIYIRAGAITGDAKNSIVCPGRDDLWVAIWNRKNPEPPTEEQFNWFERVNHCKQRRADDKRKDDELGVTKKVRSIVKREFDASLKADKSDDKSKPQKLFTDRMVELVSKQKKSRQSDDEE